MSSSDHRFISSHVYSPILLNYSPDPLKTHIPNCQSAVGHLRLGLSVTDPLIKLCSSPPLAFPTSVKAASAFVQASPLQSPWISCPSPKSMLSLSRWLHLQAQLKSCHSHHLHAPHAGPAISCLHYYSSLLPLSWSCSSHCSLPSTRPPTPGLCSKSALGKKWPHTPYNCPSLCSTQTSILTLYLPLDGGCTKCGSV